MERVSKQTAIIIVNKTDLPQKIAMDEVRKLVGDLPLITTSLKEEQGIEKLEKAIHSCFFRVRWRGDEMTYVTNIRHIRLLQQARQSVQEVMDGIHAGIHLI